jgi:hypothetical protein
MEIEDIITNSVLLTNSNLPRGLVRSTRKEVHMNRVKKVACIFLLLTTSLPSTAAQTTPAKNPSAEQAPSEKAQPGNPLLQKIISVLDRVLEAQKTFADESLRVMIQAHIADILWSYDESRARKIFGDILPVAEKLTGQDLPPPQVGVSVYSVRTQVIRLILPHDPEWATRLVESRGEISTDLKTRSTGKNRERTLLQLHLAIYFAQRDTQRTALTLKPFAENGDFNNLMLLLGMIRSKDAKAADDLFLQAVAKARLGQPSFEDIRKCASYVFPSFGDGVLRFPADGGKRDPLTSANSDPAVVGLFLDLAYDVVTKRLDATLTDSNTARLDARSMLDFAIPKLLAPYFDRFTPERAPAFRARLQAALLRVPLEERQYLVLTEPRTVEELVSTAEGTSDTRLKDTLIQRAIFRASSSDNYEQAEALIERLSSESGRLGARNMFRHTIDEKRSKEAWSALNNEDLDKAEALAAEMSDWPADGLLLKSLIGRVSHKDKPRAARILDGYQQKAAGIEERTERALRLMQLAGVAVNIDSNRGFEEMTRSIEEFNQAGFVPELERYRDPVRPRMGNPAKVNVGLSGLLGNWDLYWIGNTDLDRGLTVTRQFQLKEAAAIMQLNACRGALRGVPVASR